MGRLRKRKHPSTRNADASSGSDVQTKLPSKSGFRHITRSDINDFLIPVIKEIGKCIYPPAAVPIEILYQIYKHADAVKEVSSAVMKGDYERAKKVIMKESVKEVGEAILGAAAEPAIAKTSESLAENVSSSLSTNEQGKEIAGKIVKGTVKGVAEAAEEKVVDRIIDEVSE